MPGYNLELEKVIAVIQKEKAKTVALQLPSGLKPQATEIASKIKEETDADVVIWMEGTFGACDIPELPVDLLFHWGHSPWLKTEKSLSEQ